LYSIFLIANKEIEEIEGGEIPCNTFILVLTEFVLPFLITRDLFNLMKVDWNVCQHASKTIFLRIRDFLIKKYCSILSFKLALGYDQQQILDREMAASKIEVRRSIKIDPNVFVTYLLQQQFDFSKIHSSTIQSLYDMVLDLAKKDSDIFNMCRCINYISLDTQIIVSCCLGSDCSCEHIALDCTARYCPIPYVE